MVLLDFSMTQLGKGESVSPYCDRITCAMKMNYRKGASGRLQSKVQKVQSLVTRPLKTR